MTYYELFTKAENLLIHNKITLGEYDEMVQPLNEEVRKEGEWINDTNYSGWTCTNCGYHDGNAVDNYCPNCGAKMERRADERIHL